MGVGGTACAVLLNGVELVEVAVTVAVGVTVTAGNVAAEMGVGGFGNTVSVGTSVGNGRLAENSWGFS